MGILSPTSKKIYRDEFEKVLRGIPDLSDEERHYASGVFQDSLKGGLTKEELKREILRLRHNPTDPLDYSEVEKIKQKLTEQLK